MILPSMPLAAAFHFGAIFIPFDPIRTAGLVGKVGLEGAVVV